MQNLEPVHPAAPPHYESDSCPFTAPKLAGVALLGALGSVALYYVYATLSPETRQNMWDTAAAKLKTVAQSISSQA